MAKKVAGSLSSIITFFGVFEVLILSNYGLDLVFYDCFLLLEVFGSLFDEENEVWRWF